MTTLLPKCSAACTLLLASAVPLWSAVDPQAAQRPRDLTELSPAELAELEVTTVSRKLEKRSRTPAAVDVITQEDIRRSGLTSLADALRLVPGIQVARINSSQWAIGARGFANRTSRSMLVLIDGRSVYTPLFAGVYWEVQDTLLEDVERIEVIRGPGGTLWGANAVNGIVNIVTKSARDTLGLLLQGGGGSEERTFAAARYGGLLGERGAYRVHGKFFEREPGFHPDGNDFDGWEMGRGGFRADWDSGRGDGLMVEGDLYGARTGERTSLVSYTPPFIQTVEQDGKLSGGDLLARWQRHAGLGRELSVQLYYDRTDRDEVNFTEARDTVDLDVQQRVSLGRQQDLLVGLGYRVSRGAGVGTPTVGFDPPTRTDHLANAFVQDELSLRGGALRLTLGAKAEHNDYSGFEVQPAGRLLWEPSARHDLWLGLSRSVRTPSRLEHDLSLTALLDPRGPVFGRLIGDEAFHSEKATVYEAGYRIRPDPRAAFDLAVFYNRYADLLSVEAGGPFAEASPSPAHIVIPFLFRNGLGGRGYGAELTADVQPRRWLRLFGAYSYLRLDLQRKPGSTDTSAQGIMGTSPRHQAVLHGSIDLGRSLLLDGMLRYQSRLPGQNVPAFVSLDTRLAWAASRQLELAVVGQNLLADHHVEFGGNSSSRTEVRRGVYGQVTFRR